MNKHKVVIVILLFALVIPTVVFAQTFTWKQGYAVGHGKGTMNYSWNATLNGYSQTYNYLRRRVGDGLTSSSDTWSGAEVCFSQRVSQRGTYRVTGTIPLNGTLRANRTFSLRGSFESGVYAQIKIWQGNYPGDYGHRFRYLIASALSNKPLDQPTVRPVNEIVIRSVRYDVTDTSLPLKTCIGQVTYVKGKGYGDGTANFAGGPMTLQVVREP